MVDGAGAVGGNFDALSTNDSKARSAVSRLERRGSLTLESSVIAAASLRCVCSAKTPLALSLLARSLDNLPPHYSLLVRTLRGGIVRLSLGCASRNLTHPI